MKKILLITLMLILCGSIFSQINENYGLKTYYSRINAFRKYVMKINWHYTKQDLIDRADTLEDYFTFIKFKQIIKKDTFLYILSYEPEYSGTGNRKLYLYKTKNHKVLDSLFILNGHNNGNQNYDDDIDDYYTSMYQMGYKGSKFTNANKNTPSKMTIGKRVYTPMATVDKLGDGRILIVGCHGSNYNMYAYEVDYWFTPDSSKFRFGVKVDVKHEIQGNRLKKY